MDCRDPSSPHYGKVSAKGVRSPAPRNPRYRIPEAERPQSARELVTTFNNFYEIAYYKSLAKAAAKVDYFFMDPKWQVQITGLVDRPMTISISDLIAKMHLEERYYRHRCVEAWAIAVPWLGFPLAKLLDLVGVKSNAKYVKFISYKNAKVTPNQAQTGYYPWPYTEGITIEEARNELAFLTVGLYQKEITASNGAPIRLTLPWKYGFKSIKAIRTIEFTNVRPTTFWAVAGPKEYGFWANVNPTKPHRRWSQATERRLISDPYTKVRIPTQKFNGYESKVAHMYHGMDETKEDLWH